MQKLTEVKCTICNNPVDLPFRHIEDGKIIEGCVAEDHNGRLPQDSATLEWHNRPMSKAIRAQARELIKYTLR